MSKLIKIGIISLPAFALGAAYGLADTDSFSYVVSLLRGQNSLAFFNLANYPDIFSKLFYLALIIGSCLGAALALTGPDIRRYPFQLLTFGACVVIAYAAAHFLIGGKTGILASLAGTPMRPWYLFVGLPLMAYSASTRSVHLVPFAIGFLVASAVKCLVVAAIYATGGGVAFLDQIRSMVADGGFLTNLTVAVLCGAVLVLWFRSSKYPFGSFVSMGLLFLFLIPIIGSFRRSMLVYTVIAVAQGLIFYYHVKGQLVRRLPTMILSALILGGVILFGYITFFGLEDATERLRSLTLQSETSQYAGSNNYYLDDWMSWTILVRTKGIVGIGFNTDYGLTDRLTIDAASAAGMEVPLHVGMFELWVRLGIVGALFHILSFVLLPLWCIFKKRPCGDERLVIASSFAASFLVLVGLFPFSPPQYMSINMMVPCGIAWGLLAAAYAKGAENSNPKFLNPRRVRRFSHV